MKPTVVYLAQTDTTVGFLSQNSKRLEQIKDRQGKKGFIVSVDSLKGLKNFLRVPKNHKKFVRRSRKTTIVYPNGYAIRVVHDKEHLRFLRKIKWAYSTSSNPSGYSFDEEFAIDRADIIVYNRYGFSEKCPSKIIKCGKISKRRLR